MPDSSARYLWLFLLIQTAVILANPLNAQEDSAKEKESSIKFSGFIKWDLIADSRKNLESREGFVLFYPKRPERDIYGKDLNNRMNLNQYGMSSRLTGTYTGPVLLGAASQALLEGDFTGASNMENNSFRLRHAYVRLSWVKAELLMGQYWHPLDLPEALPLVVSLNTGAPFHSFSRYPQIRFRYRAGRADLIVVAAGQRDYSSNGPAGITPDYLRNSGIPNLHGQVHFRLSGITQAGIAGDYRRLSMRLSTDSLLHRAEMLDCFAALAFLKTEWGPLSLKFQTVWGQNLFEHLMLGGVAVHSTDPATDSREWTSIDMASGWSQIAWRKGAWQASLFGGYARNLGSQKSITGAFFGRGNDLLDLFRISPILSWNQRNLSFSLETEWTSARYGQPDGYAKVEPEERVSNIRLTLSTLYSF